MRVIHVTEQGAELRLQGQTLQVWREGQRLAIARLPLLERLVLHGAVHFTPALLARLLAEGIDCVFLTQSGRFRARLETLDSAAAELRVAQARAAADPHVRLAACRAIARNRILSQARVLRALRLPAAQELEAMAVRAQEVSSEAEAQGTEGFAARIYFAAVRAALPSGFASWTRRRRPPPDGLNALLSYGYAILQSRVHTAVALVGADPWIGFLHQLGRPRPAFVLDMMEEFRAPVVDFTCWRLVGAWGPEGWWSETPEGARLGDEARRELIARVEARLAARVLHRPTNTRVTMERAIELQIRSFAAGLKGHWGRYQPLKPLASGRR